MNIEGVRIMKDYILSEDEKTLELLGKDPTYHYVNGKYDYTTFRYYPITTLKLGKNVEKVNLYDIRYSNVEELYVEDLKNWYIHYCDGFNQMVGDYCQSTGRYDPQAYTEFVEEKNGDFLLEFTDNPKYNAKLLHDILRIHQNGSFLREYPYIYKKEKE